MSYLLIFFVLIYISASFEQNVDKKGFESDKIVKKEKSSRVNQIPVNGANGVGDVASDEMSAVCGKLKKVVTFYYELHSSTKLSDNEVDANKNMEVFSLYEGDKKIELNKMFKSRIVNGVQSTKLCLSDGEYEIEKNEKSNSNIELGVLKIEVDNRIISTVKLNELKEKERAKVNIGLEMEKRSLIQRELSGIIVLPETSEWGYSYKSQDDNSWSNTENDWMTYVPERYPLKVTTTTYYRTKFTLPDIAATNSPILKVKYRDGLIVYVNGYEIFRKNMPLDGDITSETKAIKSFDTLIQSTISIPQPIINSFDNYIGIEIHKSDTSDGTQTDEFAASIETTDRVEQTVTTADNVDIKIATHAGEAPIAISNLDNMFSMSTAHCNVEITTGQEARWFPMNFDFTFKNHVAKYMNQFEMSGCADNAFTHPKGIRIYASVDSENINWIKLFDKFPMGFLIENCNNKDVYELPSMNKAFESYRLEVYKNDWYDHASAYFIRFKLFILDEKPVAMCQANDDYPSTNIGMTSISYCGSGYKSVKCGENGQFQAEVDHSCDNGLIKNDNNKWQYTDAVPPSNSWNKEYIDGESDWNKKTSSSFPEFTSSIRYYRNYFMINDISVSGSPKLKIAYKDGIKIYINGNEIFKRNFNGGVIAPFGSATEETIVIPLPVLLNGKNIIGIEIHRTDPFGQDPLIVSLEYNRLSITTVTTTTTVDVDGIGLISHKNLPPNSYSDFNKSFSMASSSSKDNPDYCGIKLVAEKKADYLPFYITYKFSGYNAFYFNEFKISGCSNNFNTNPNNIKILGATDKDHPEWEELYSNTDLGVKRDNDCDEVKTFSIENVKKSYESYRLVVVDTINYDAYPWTCYIQYRLFILNSISFPICYSYDGFGKVFAGQSSIIKCQSGYKERRCLENGIWENEIIDHECKMVNYYLSTKPYKENTLTLEKDIKSLSSTLPGLTFSGNTLTLRSDEELELIKSLIITFNDDSTATLYVSVLRGEIKCNYGFDSINLFEMEYDLTMKCNSIKPIIGNIENLPSGLKYDLSDGRIAGRINDVSKEITSTVTFHSDKEYKMTIEWKKGGNLQSGLELISWKDQQQDGITSDSIFQGKKLKDMWVKYDNGQYSIKDPIVITNVEITLSDSVGNCLDNWNPCQYNVLRIRGYIYIDEERDYVLSGKSDDSQKFAFENFEFERYTTADWEDEGEFTSHLAKGYHIVGYLSWAGTYGNGFNAYYKKGSDEKVKINNIMYNGGFLLTHLSYGALTIIYEEGVSRAIAPSYEGYPSKWSMTPTIEGLSIRLDGAIIGVPTNCDNQFRSVEISSNGAIDISKATIQIICYRNNKENKMNGLLVKYYTANSVSIDSFEEPESASGSKLMLERVENSPIFHFENEELWNHLFIADYNGYLNTGETGSYKMRLKCYDYCRLELGSDIFEGIGSGYHEIDKTVELTNQLYKLRIVYIKSGNDNIKQLEFLYEKNGEYVTIPNEWLFINQPYPFIYSSIFSRYYVNNEISNTITNTNVNLDGFKYSIYPSLPTGLSISTDTGEISGTPNSVDLEKVYTITAEKDGVKYYSEIKFEVRTQVEPVIEYPSSGLVGKVNENFELSPTTNIVCDVISIDSPVDFIFIDSKGKLKGKAIIGSYSGTVTVKCTTYKTISVEVSVNIACDEGNEFLIMDYLVKSQPESVKLELMNGETLIYSSSSEGSLVANSVYTFMKCVPKATNQLKITSNSNLGGWYKLYYGYKNMFKYNSFFRNETISFSMSPSSNKPILSYGSTSFELSNEIYYELYPSIENGGKEFEIKNEENLPTGMIFDKESGLIYGTPTETSEAKPVKISVKNVPNGGTSDELTLTFSSSVCKKIFFEVNLYVRDFEQSFVTYKMAKEDGKEIQLFDKQVGENKKYFCEDPTIYEITLGSTGNQVWEYNEMRVQILHNGAVLFRGRNTGGESESKAKINTKNLVPFINQMKYTDEVQENNNWSEISFDSSKWNSVNDLPAFENGKLIRYYYQSFDFTEDVTDLSMFYLSFKFSNGGIRMFMNGVEFYNKYLPKEITSDTAGQSYVKSERKYFVTAPVTLLQKSGNNVLGIEFHKADITSVDQDEFKIMEFHLLSGINSCQFDKYTYFEAGNADQEYQTISEDENVENAFNYILDKYMKATWQPTSLPMWFEFKFANEESRWFNGLQYRTGSNLNRLIKKFEAYGIRTYPNGASNDLLPVFYYPDNTTETLVYSYHSKYFSLKNDNLMAFNGIRINVLEKDSDGFDTGGVYPYSCRSSCFTDGEWKSVPFGETARISCGMESTAFIKRKCGDNGEWNEVDDSDCGGKCSKTIYDTKVEVYKGGYAEVICPNDATKKWKALCNGKDIFVNVSDECVTITYPENIITQSGKTINISPSISSNPPTLTFTEMSGPDFLTVEQSTGSVSGTVPSSVLEGKEYELVIQVKESEAKFKIKIEIKEPSDNDEFLALITSGSETIEITKSYAIDMSKWTVPDSVSFKKLITKGDSTIRMKHYVKENENNELSLLGPLESVEIEHLRLIIEYYDGISSKSTIKAKENGIIKSIENSYLYDVELKLECNLEMEQSEDKTFGLLSNSMENMIMIHVGIYFDNKISINSVEYISTFGLISGSISNSEGKEVSGVFVKGNEYEFKSTASTDPVIYEGLLFGNAKDLIISYSFSDLNIYNVKSIKGISNSLTVAHSKVDSSYVKFYRCFAIVREIANIESTDSTLFGPFISRSKNDIYVDECWNDIKFGKLIGTMDVVGFRGHYEESGDNAKLELSNSYAYWKFTQSTDGNVGINCISKYCGISSTIENVYVSIAVESSVSLNKISKIGEGIDPTVKAVYIQRPSNLNIDGIGSITLLDESSDIKEKPYKYLNGFYGNEEKSQLYYSIIPQYDEKNQVIIDKYKILENVDISFDENNNPFYKKSKSIWFRSENPYSFIYSIKPYSIYMISKESTNEKMKISSNSSCIVFDKNTVDLSNSLKKVTMTLNGCNNEPYSKHVIDVVDSNNENTKEEIMMEIINDELEPKYKSDLKENIDLGSEFYIEFNLPYPSSIELTKMKDVDINEENNDLIIMSENREIKYEMNKYVYRMNFKSANVVAPTKVEFILKVVFEYNGYKKSEYDYTYLTTIEPILADSFSYPKNNILTINEEFSISPQYKGYIEEFIIKDKSISSKLENSGIKFDEKSGIFSGKPTVTFEPIEIEVKMKNYKYEKTTKLIIEVLHPRPKELEYEKEHLLAIGLETEIKPSKWDDSVDGKFSYKSSIKLEDYNLRLNDKNGIINGIPSKELLEYTEVRIILSNKAGSIEFTIQIFIEEEPDFSFHKLITSDVEAITLERSYVIDMRYWKIPEGLKWKRLEGKDEKTSITIECRESNGIELFKELDNKVLKHIHFIIKMKSDNNGMRKISIKSKSIIESIKNSYLYDIELRVNNDLLLETDNANGLLSNSIADSTLIRVGIISDKSIEVNIKNNDEKIFGLISGKLINNNDDKMISGIFVKLNYYKIEFSNDNNSGFKNGLLFGEMKERKLSYSFVDINEMNVNINNANVGLMIGENANEMKIYKSFVIVRNSININGNGNYGVFSGSSNNNLIINECFSDIKVGKIESSLSSSLNLNIKGKEVINSYSYVEITKNIPPNMKIYLISKDAVSSIVNTFISIRSSVSLGKDAILTLDNKVNKMVQNVYIQRTNGIEIKNNDERINIIDGSEREIKENIYKYMNDFYLGNDKSKLFYSKLPRYENNRVIDEYKMLEAVDIIFDGNNNPKYSKNNNIFYLSDIPLSKIYKENISSSGYSLYLLSKENTNEISLEDSSSCLTIDEKPISLSENKVELVNVKAVEVSDTCLNKMLNHIELNIKSNNKKIIPIPINIVNREKDPITRTEPEIVQEMSNFYLLFDGIICDVTELKDHSSMMNYKQKQINNEVENVYSRIEISITKISTIDRYYNKTEEICVEYYFNGYFKSQKKCMIFTITIEHTFPPTLPPPPLISTELPSYTVTVNEEINKIIHDAISAVQSVNEESKELNFKPSIKNHIKIENAVKKEKENDVKTLPHATTSSTKEFIKTISKLKLDEEKEANKTIIFTESHSIKIEDYTPPEIESGTNLNFGFNKVNIQVSLFDGIRRRRSLDDDEEKKKKKTMRLFGDLSDMIIENGEFNIYSKESRSEIVINECGLFGSLNNSYIKNIKLKIYNNIRFDCNDNSTVNGLINGRSENVTYENVVIEFYKDGVRTLAIENKDSNRFGMIVGEGSDIKLINCNVFGDIITVINNGNNSKTESSVFGGLIGVCEDNCEISKSYMQVNNILLYQSIIFGGLVGSMEDDSEVKVIGSYVYIEDGLRIGVNKDQNEFVYGSFIGDTNKCAKVMIDNCWTIFITMGIEINTTNTNFGGMIGKIGSLKEDANDTIIITNSSMQMPIGHNTFIFRNEDSIDPSPNIGFIFGTNLTNIDLYRLDHTMAYVESCSNNNNIICISPQMYYKPTGVYPSTLRRILIPTENNFCSGSGALVSDGIFATLEAQGNEYCNSLGKTTCEGYNGICYDPLSYSPCTIRRNGYELTLSKDEIYISSSKLVCPNNCTKNGVCVYGECRCYPGFTSFDCRLRTCPYGSAISNPLNEYDEDNRLYYECSNQGKCNRENGLCECYAGFEGSSCQRRKCPNECNNHGICMTLNEAELNKENKNINDNDENNYDINYVKKYDKWDKESIQVCVCDKEYRGADCSIRKCPYGYLSESECDSLPQSEVTITYESNEVIRSIANKIYVKYTDPFNRKWFTNSFSINDRDGWLNALGSLSPDSISIDELSANNENNNKVVIHIIFSRHQTGRQYPIEIIGSKEMKEIVELNDIENGYYHWLNPKLEGLLNTEKGSFTYEIDYTQRSSECSNNGICDTKSGICKCFDGFIGIACGEVEETL